jgi:hypothetical protein
MPFSIGSRLLVQIGEQSSSLCSTNRARFAELAEGPVKSSTLRGDFLLTAGDRFEDSIAISLRHLGLTSEGIEVSQGQTGSLSILGISGRGALSKTDGEWVLDMPISASVHYRAIEELLPFDVKDDRYIPRSETFAGRVTGKLEVINPGDSASLRFKDGSSLKLEYSEGGLGWIRNFSVPFQGLTLSLVNPSSEGEAEFKLKVQPIGFKSTDGDPTPSGVQWSNQLKQAAVVWRRCGVSLEVQNFITVVSATRKTSSDPLVVRGTEDPEAATVEVYFTAAEMADGGGIALSCGSALAAIVVSDQQTDELNLVAHEIGHILNGVHPTDPAAAGEWNGEPGSVMEPVELIPTSLLALGANSCGNAKQAAFEVVKA